MILIIDDDEVTSDFARNCLEAFGFKVMTAATGLKGIDIANDTEISLVITDVFMPDMDGLEVIRHLKHSNPLIPIIAVSGGDPRFGQDYLTSAAKLGADAILTKPFSPAHLLSLIRGLLQRDVQPG